MEITVQCSELGLNDARPHFCAATRQYVGLRFAAPGHVGELFCPWCGMLVPTREPGHNYARAVRPERFAGPYCEHGFPDVACVELAAADEKATFELMCGAIREYRAAELANRFGCARSVTDWVRPCPQCRKAVAIRRRPLLRYELEQVATALSAEVRAAYRHVDELRNDLRLLHEAFFELDDLATSSEGPERRGFVYLIGHSRAVKIGWSDKHPAVAGGRVAKLRVASADDLVLLGLIEAPFSREREIQSFFAEYRLRGEWFRRSEQILAYFVENGLPV